MAKRVRKSEKSVVDDIWTRYEVDPETVKKHSEITPILKKSLGSIDKVIEYLRGSDDKEARELLRLWDSATAKDKKILPFEAFCLSAKSTPKQMMGVIMKAVLDQSERSAELLTAAAHPEIVQKTIKIAKTKAGEAERKMILQNRGFLPMPKNQVLNNFGSISQDNRKQVANVSVGQLDTDNDDIASAVDEFNATRMLKAPQDAEVIDVVAEDV